MSMDSVITSTTSKLRSRNRAKAKVKKCNVVCPTELQQPKTPEIHIVDDLGLDSLPVCNIPEDMLFPGEYNVYLQDRLKTIGDENKLLSTLLKEREEELASTKDKLSQFEMQLSDHGVHHATILGNNLFHRADLAVCRIMELSKQVCDLTAQLEDQRSRCMLAEKKLLAFIKCGEEKQPVSADLSKKEAETKILSEKLQVANSKLFESRNKIQQLQQELKNAHKVVMNEVGDGVSISDLISSGGSSGNWRGRAQQIQVLQQRVIDLSDRLRKCCDHRTPDFPSSSCVEGKWAIKEKNAAVETAQQETRMVQLQLDENIKKLSAAKARIKVLDSEIGSFKAQIQLLIDKSARDDDFIHTLQGQVSRLEECLQASKDEARSEIKKSEKYYKLLLDDQQLEKQRNIHLLSKLEDKEKQIKHLEEILHQFRDKEVKAFRTDTSCAEIAVPLLQVPSITTVHNSGTYIKENQEILPTEIGCKGLLEVVGALNRRLNNARHECDKHKNALSSERLRLAKLEAKLTRMEMERSSGSFCSARRLNVTKKENTVCNHDLDSMSKEDLHDRHELLEEEILTLKTRISCLEQEKEDDLRAFSLMLSCSSQQVPLNRSQNSVMLPALVSSKSGCFSPPIKRDTE